MAGWNKDDAATGLLIYLQMLASILDLISGQSAISEKTGVDVPPTENQRKHAIKIAGLKADLFKVLSNPVRIRILNELRDGEQSVSELVDRLGLEMPAVSQQLSILRRQNLVLGRKDGVSIYYSCADTKVYKLLDVTREIMIAHLAEMQKTIKATGL